VREYLLRLDQLGPGRELALWVALSIGLYLLFAQLAWRLRKWETGLLGENIRWLDGWRFRRLAWQLLRLLFYVVIPYGLLVQRRLLTGRSMGLVGPEPAGVLGWTEAGWLGGLGWVLLCGAAGVALLVGSWWALARRLEGEEIFYLHHRLPAWEILWDAVFLQLHWGFFRAAAVAWLGETELIWGVFLGLGLGLGAPRCCSLVHSDRLSPDQEPVVGRALSLGHDLCRQCPGWTTDPLVGGLYFKSRLSVIRTANITAARRPIRFRSATTY